ncbi:UvrD-helicase domain-containing protein [Azospirillum thermophilum]|uniref:UvrD-helicase domain-containing protein n=1 Tax=Azospirillum thermophilum TaxID=2202148 RepID=UPI0026D5737E
MSLVEFPSRSLPLDPNVAQRRASDPMASVWVGASAGSGKTKVLTDRVLRLMLSGTPPARILCLTFTKAAAAEMSIRINRTLGIWATLSDAALEDRLADLTGERPSPEMRTNARRLFAQVVDCPGGMKIQTIHAFCQSLLRRFPLEAGLAPHFEVMDDRTAAGLLTEARDAVLHAGRAAPDTPLGTAMGRLTADLNAEEFTALLNGLTAERGRIQRIFERFGGLDGAVEAVHRKLQVPPGTTEADILGEACHDDCIDAPTLREACRALGTAARRPGARHRHPAMAGRRRQPGEGLPGLCPPLPDRRGQPAQDPDHQEAGDRLPRRPDRAGARGRPAGRADGAVKAAGVAASTGALLTLAEALLGEYDRRKKARALLDYDDLILAANALLKGTPERRRCPGCCSSSTAASTTS